MILLIIKMILKNDSAVKSMIIVITINSYSRIIVVIPDLSLYIILMSNSKIVKGLYCY